MKNSRLIAALLAATLMISCVPVQAVEQKSRLSKVKKHLNESLDRFKRCMRGKCDRREALKVARDVGIATAAVLALVGGGSYLARTVFARKKYDEQVPAQRVGETASLHRAQLASGKKPKRGRQSQSIIDDEEFSRIIEGEFERNFPKETKDYLRQAFTQRDDDALAMVWIMRSAGVGRTEMKGAFGSGIFQPNSPLLGAAERIEYGLAINILKLAVVSGQRSESTKDLLQAIMNEKRTDPLFQIAHLLARAGYFSGSLSPLTTQDASRETQHILESVQDQSQIRRLKDLINRFLALISPDWKTSEGFGDERGAITRELEGWAKAH